MTDRRDRLIRGIEHTAGLTDPDTVHKFDKAVACGGLKIAPERCLGHACHFGGLIHGNRFGEMLDDVVDNVANTCLLTPALRLGEFHDG